MNKTTKIDKQKAIELRTEGKTYNEISALLGCSVDWCKRNLSQIAKTSNTQDDLIVSECLDKALSKQGITSSEIITTIKKHKPELQYSSYKQIEPIYKRIRRRILTNPNAIIRPYWMLPDTPTECYHSILQAVDLMDRRIDEEIEEIKLTHGLDDSYTKSLKHALYSLCQLGNLFSSIPSDVTASNIDDVINLLEERNSNDGGNQQYTTLHPIYISNKKCSEQDEIDALCFDANNENLAESIELQYFTE